MNTRRKCYAVIRNDNNVVAKLLDTPDLPDEDKENGRIIEIDAAAGEVHVGMVYDPSDNKFISPQDSNAARDRRKQERSDAASERERTESADRVARQMGGNRPEAAKDIERAEKDARDTMKGDSYGYQAEPVGFYHKEAAHAQQTKPETIGKVTADPSAENRTAEAQQKEQAKRASQRAAKPQPAQQFGGTRSRSDDAI